MALAPPKVDGPLGVCSEWVRVRNQNTGAHVKVYADDEVVAEDDARAPVQSFELDRALTSDEVVSASQTVGSETSGRTPEPHRIEIQEEPDDRHFDPAMPVFECARCIQFDHVVPGATVTVQADGRNLGSGTDRGRSRVRVGLDRELRAGETVTAVQTACGDDKGRIEPSLEHPVGDEQVEGEELERPDVAAADACERRVDVTGATPGARFKVTRSDGPNQVGCAELPDFYLDVNPPLSEGETVSARSEFPECGICSPPAEPVTVGPTEIPRPRIREPICDGSKFLTVRELKYRARVRITVTRPSAGAAPSGTTILRGEASESGEVTFFVPEAEFPDGLPEGAQVSVQQELCSRESESPPVTVSAAPMGLEPPVVLEPLYECAGRVHVRNLQPDTEVVVYSDSIGRLGSRFVHSEETDVSVYPSLEADEEVYAISYGCGLPSAKSEAVEVRELDDLGPPEIEEVYDCDDSVTVTNVVPGAYVDIYVDGVWRGRTTSSEEETSVPVAVGELKVGDMVRARQRLCGRTSDPSQGMPVREYEGEWELIGEEGEIEDKAQILPIHAALLPTEDNGGMVLYFGGDQHHLAAHEDEDVDHTRLYDVESGDVTSVTGLTTDVFCAGHALLEDGSLITGGGTSDWIKEQPKFYGSRASWWYDPWRDDDKLDEWEKVSDLVPAQSDYVDGDRAKSGGRWYPTLVTLPDGRVLALGGEPDVDDTRDVNNSLELYDPDPSSQSWSIVGDEYYSNIPGASANQEAEEGYERDRQGDSEYMRLHVLPEGTVLSVSEMDDGTVEKWDPYTVPDDPPQVVDGLPDDYSTAPQAYTSALLPLLADDGWGKPRVLLAGGGSLKEEGGAGEAYVLDVEDGSCESTERALAGRPTRHYSVATLLPTGEVAITGGVTPSLNEERELLHLDKDAVREVEIFDPAKLSVSGASPWRVGPDAEVVRNYHSVALLLPDGSVWTAGSNKNAEAGGRDKRQHRLEVYKPWYFCYDRPSIINAPDRVCHGESFEIQIEGTERIAQVALVRCGSVTHAFNPDQRHVTLPFEQDGNTLEEVEVPSDAAVAIPGYYLLYVLKEVEKLDEDGDREIRLVPSEGRFLQICQAPASSVRDSPLWLDVEELLRQWLDIPPPLIESLERDIKSHLFPLDEARLPPQVVENAFSIATLHVDAEGDDHRTLNDEYVEFENTGTTQIDLTGWTVEDEAGHTYVFPRGVTLDAGTTVRLRSGTGTDTESDLYWGASEPVWNNTGDTVYVYDTERNLILTESY